MSLRLAAEMLIMGGIAKNLAEAEAKVAHSIASGSAMEKYRTWVTYNGGEAKALDDFSLLPGYAHTVEVLAETSGTIHAMDSRALGILAMELGAGRASKDDVLDLGVGIRVHANVGQTVAKGQPLLTLYLNERKGNPLPKAWITIKAEPCQPFNWLLETVE